MPPASLPTAITSKLVGPLAPVLCAFDDDGRLDTDSTCRWVQSLIDRGIRLFWTTHGTSNYMCLSDDEVEALNRAVAGVTRGKATFIASTAYFWPAPKSIEFTHKALDWGVDAVKIQLDWRAFPPTDDLLVEHYTTIAKASPLPLFAYTWGQPGIRPPLLRRILDIPQFIGLKNDTGDYDEQAEYLRVVREARAMDRFVPMTGGSMSSFLFGAQFGAKAFATGTAIYAPQVAVSFHEHVRAKNYQDAAHDVSEYEFPVVTAFAPLGHWACFHAALKAQGLFKSMRMRYPIRTLSEADATQVRELLTARGLFNLK